MLMVVMTVMLVFVVVLFVVVVVIVMVMVMPVMIMMVIVVYVLMMMLMPVQIFHVMIVVFIFLVGHDIKIAAVKSCLLYSFYFKPEALYIKAFVFFRPSAEAPRSKSAATNMSPLMPELHSRYSVLPILSPFGHSFLSARRFICVAI